MKIRVSAEDPQWLDYQVFVDGEPVVAQEADEEEGWAKVIKGHFDHAHPNVFSIETDEYGNALTEVLRGNVEIRRV